MSDDDTRTHITLVQPADLVPADAASADLSAILRAARDPSTNIDTVERLLAMHRDLVKDQQRTAFRAAKARLQEKLPQIGKHGRIVTDKSTRKFARLEDIDQVVRPLCAEEGFSFSYDSRPVPQGVEFSCEMSHRDGHAEVKTLTLPLDVGGSKNAVQAVGSTTSYARRYLLEMHLNLVKRDEDDDGNGGRGPVTKEQAGRLRAMLAEVKGNEARFLNWAAAPTFEDIPAGNYERCVRFIEEKREAGK